MFSKFDKDGDQALSPQELVNMFSTCPRLISNINSLDANYRVVQRILGYPQVYFGALSIFSHLPLRVLFASKVYFVTKGRCKNVGKKKNALLHAHG